MKQLLYILVCLLFVGCGNTHDLPSSYTQIDRLPSIFPDYAEVVIPPNIAPLNFMIDEEGIEDCRAEFSCRGMVYVLGQDSRVMIDEDDWQEIVQAAKGSSIKVTVYAKRSDKWMRYRTFSIIVAEDSIDRYVTYRLIPPSYTLYEKLSLCQRDLQTFDESLIYNNQMLESVDGGQCINCHSVQNYRTDRAQFHVRAEYGGTVIYDNGKLRKVDLKREGTISAGVYPAWHPTEDIIAYSMNRTMQNFHTIYKGKVEVQDTQGGLMLYDVQSDKVTVISNEQDRLSAFPTWGPDGKYLYYASAKFDYRDSLSLMGNDDANISMQHEIVDRYKEVKYDIYRRSYHSESKTFGKEEMVLCASAMGKSATVPRISPEGRYLLVAMGDYGCFHIWHPEADLYVTDLSGDDALQSTYPLTAANSNRAESFHNWSSNGRWIIFESRRWDNNYTRLYVSYFDRKGHAHKAFQMPQENPDFEIFNRNSYNVPEFTVEKVKTTPQELARVIRED